MSSNEGGNADPGDSSLFGRNTGKRRVAFFYDIKEELQMIDIKRLRQDFDAIQEKLAHRGEDLTDMNRFLSLCLLYTSDAADE